MKINQNVIFLNPAAAAPASAAASGKSPAAASSAVPAHSAAPASQARLPSTTGDFDAGRVAEIRDSIRAGSYRVDTARIADGLLSTVRDLVERKPS